MRRPILDRFRRTLHGMTAAGLIASVVLAAACADSDEDGGNGSTDATPTALRGAGSDLAPVDGAAIYEAASPAIPRVTGAAGTSAGLLVEGGLVLTAAGVVTAGGPISVAFPDGTVLSDVPVAAVDVGTGIGVLGPIESGITPAPLVASDSVAPGTELFALGYGATGDAPAISRVMLASSLDWEAGALTLLQLDEPGIDLEGMVVVLDRSGRTVALKNDGASGRFAVSAAVANDRATALLEDGDAPSRVLDAATGKPVQTLMLGASQRQGLIAFQAAKGSPTTVVVEGDAAVAVLLLDPTGQTLLRGESVAGDNLVLTLEPGAGGPRLALIELADPVAVPEPIPVEVSADVDLSLFVDPDDDAVLTAGDQLEGSLDFPGDLDVLFIDLVEGQNVTLLASSPVVDPLLELEPLGDDPGLVDDDSGKGAFGSDAAIQLKASTPGRHVLLVSDALLEATGGYSVSVAGTTSDAQLAETIDQIRGLADSVMTDPRGEAALLKLLSGMLVVDPPVLPAAYGSAWRGTSTGDGLITEVATTDTVEGEGSARTIEDGDGRFTVRATVLAGGQATAVPLVTNSAGEAVPTGANATLQIVCAEDAVCSAALSLAVTDAAALGPWTVSLAPQSGVIEAWQIEVLPAGAAEGEPSLPPGR